MQVVFEAWWVGGRDALAEFVGCECLRDVHGMSLAMRYGTIAYMKGRGDWVKVGYGVLWERLLIQWFRPKVSVS